MTTAPKIHPLFLKRSNNNNNPTTQKVQSSVIIDIDDITSNNNTNEEQNKNTSKKRPRITQASSPEEDTIEIIEEEEDIKDSIPTSNDKVTPKIVGSQNTGDGSHSDVKSLLANAKRSRSGVEQITKKAKLKSKGRLGENSIQNYCKIIESDSGSEVEIIPAHDAQQKPVLQVITDSETYLSLSSPTGYSADAYCISEEQIQINSKDDSPQEVINKSGRPTRKAALNAPKLSWSISDLWLQGRDSDDEVIDFDDGSEEKGTRARKVARTKGCKILPSMRRPIPGISQTSRGSGMVNGSRLVSSTPVRSTGPPSNVHRSPKMVHKSFLRPPSPKRHSFFDEAMRRHSSRWKEAEVSLPDSLTQHVSATRLPVWNEDYDPSGGYINRYQTPIQKSMSSDNLWRKFQPDYLQPDDALLDDQSIHAIYDFKQHRHLDKIQHKQLMQLLYGPEYDPRPRIPEITFPTDEPEWGFDHPNICLLTGPPGTGKTTALKRLETFEIKPDTKLNQLELGSRLRDETVIVDDEVDLVAAVKAIEKGNRKGIIVCEGNVYHDALY